MELEQKSSGPREGKIYAALGKVMSGLKVLEKKQRNDFARYDYRGIDDLLNSVHGLLDDAGVIVLPECLTENPKLELGPTTRDGKQQYTILLKMAYTFLSTEDGSAVRSGPFVGEGIDTSDKCSNKAQTAAFKWCFFQTFCVPVEGGMADSEVPNDIDKQDAKAEARNQLSQELENAVTGTVAPQVGKQPPPSQKPATRQPQQPGAKTGDKDSQHRAELQDILDEITGGNRDLQAGWLKSWSIFQGPVDKADPTKGMKDIWASDINKLSGKWLNMIIDKARVTIGEIHDGV